MTAQNGWMLNANCVSSCVTCVIILWSYMYFVGMSPRTMSSHWSGWLAVNFEGNYLVQIESNLCIKMFSFQAKFIYLNFNIPSVSQDRQSDKNKILLNRVVRCICVIYTWKQQCENYPEGGTTQTCRCTHAWTTFLKCTPKHILVMM